MISNGYHASVLGLGARVLLPRKAYSILLVTTCMKQKDLAPLSEEDYE